MFFFFLIVITITIFYYNIQQIFSNNIYYNHNNKVMQLLQFRLTLISRYRQFVYIPMSEPAILQRQSD